MIAALRSGGRPAPVPRFRRFSYSIWPQYVPVAERRRNAARLAGKLAASGRALQPVRIEGRGRKIAQTFWGESWCANLERYSDFANRLPRGRTYVRNGSVIDLQIAAGKVTALVSGSEVYDVEITVQPLAAARWQQLRCDCGGSIDSLVELLQGRFSRGVMDVLCRAGTGMFPEPGQIALSCSCPDSARMCKHVAAVLYGIGARLDAQPELLFVLRQVDHNELIAARVGGVLAASGGDGATELAGEDLGAIFGIELAEAEPAAAAAPRPKQPRARGTGRGQEAAVKAPAKVRRGKRRLPPTIMAAELRRRGVPNHVVQAWLGKGVIEHSGERGVYVRGAGVEALVEDYLARRRRPRMRSRS